MAKQVIITVNRFGDTKIDAEGFVGKECDKATMAYEKVLAVGGGQAVRTNKPEYEGAPAATTGRETVSDRF